MKIPLPARVRILYLMLGVLIIVALGPLGFFGLQLISSNRAQLVTNERIMQNTITRSLADDVDQRQNNLNLMLGNLASSIRIASGSDLQGAHLNSPELLALLKNFVSQSGIVPYATLINKEEKGLSAGSVSADAFLTKQLERGFREALEGHPYNGEPIEVGGGGHSRVLMLESVPVTTSTGESIGMVAALVDLQFLINRLQESSQNGLTAYVVDHSGRLVAGTSPEYATGQDMTNIDLVKSYSEQNLRIPISATQEFEMTRNNRKVAMLGTYSPVPKLSWAVVAQKAQQDAYSSVYEMERTALLLAVFAVLISVLFSLFAARGITTPLQTLTESSRAIAKGDFSRRVVLRSRTEIGELAATFNTMSSDLERFVHDLKRAAEENRNLFMTSIQMLAGAVDEKDPYTKGHSDRVTKYSVLIAKELGLSATEIEKVKISAQLHDVGKIGIPDQILKKPGALTPEEYEIMKMHTVKGATILRPVAMLAEMIPGIELHHESMDGKGYPYGLKMEAIPTLPRIIMVADTFDAMTTNRPYQAAMDAEYVIRIINSLAGAKFDPRVVKAITNVFQKGGLRIQRAGTVTEQQVAAGDGAAPSRQGATAAQATAQPVAKTAPHATPPATQPITSPAASQNAPQTNPASPAAVVPVAPVKPAISPFITREPVSKG